MKKIIVTGGAGYIGLHIAYRYRDAGYEVHLIDDLSQGNADLTEGFVLHQVDITDADALEGLLVEIKPEAVAHLAGKTLVEESTKKPELYHYVNSQGTKNLIDAMEASGCTKLLFASTCAVFGQPKKIPLVEDGLKKPIHPYGGSKYAAEQHIVEHGNQSPDFRYTIFRFFNAAGAHPSGKIGELHDPETHLIPCLLQAVHKGNCEVQVFGNDFATPDGTCVRDYIHVCDIANAFAQALEHMEDPFQEIFHIGSARGYSVLEVMNVVEKVTGVSLKKKICSRRQGDPAILVGSIDKIQNRLGWTPQHSLEEMILSAHLFYQKHKVAV